MSSVGQILGGVVGGALGFIAGGNVFLGAQIGMTLGGMVDPPKGPTVEGPRISDLSVQSSTYGASIARVYGTCIVAGNVIWVENNKLKEVRTKKKSGGKGGPKTTTKTYSYYATFAVGLCEGPIAGVMRIWIGPNLIYHAGSTDTATIKASNAAATGFRVYNGTDTQDADPRIQATIGVNDTPAWRGLAYIVFDDLPLEKYGNSLQGAQVRVEVVSNGSFEPRVSTNNVPGASGQHQWSPGFCEWGGISISHWPSPTSIYLYSEDGLQWSERHFPVAGFWRDAYGHGRMMCAVSFSPPMVVMSEDGIQWRTATLPYRAYGDITNNGSVWCISAYGYAAVSQDDGQTWSETALPTETSDLTCCISHNGRILICDPVHAEYFISDDDGQSFTQKIFPYGSSKGLVGVASNGSVIVGIVGGGPQSHCSISSDGGTTWGAPVEIAAGFAGWVDLCYGRGVFLASSGNNIAWSIDQGTTWNTLHIAHADDAFFSMRTTAFTGAVFSTVPTSFGTACYTVSFGLNSADDTLAAVVSAECKLAGLADDEIDASALTSALRGYRIGSRGTLRSAIEPLQAAWPFDVVPSGYKIAFKARGGAAVATIAAADLGAHSGDDIPVTITASREMDTQLPRKIALQYLDVDRDQERGEQFAERGNTAATNTIARELPISLTATEAAGMAEVLLYLAWLERWQISFNLPLSYNQLEPGDIINLPTSEGTASVRLTSVNYTSDGRLECKGRYNQAAVYTPTAVGAPSASAPTQTIPLIGKSIYYLLDLPTVSSKQSGPSFLVAMSGASGWPGGVLMQSTDAGGTWEVLRDFSAPGATLGACENALVAVEPRLVDHTGVLTVNLRQGALYSVSRLAMLGGANACAYGAPGRWEILAAQTITPLGGTRYALQDMLRGLAGTEWAMGLHAPGDTLLLLDPADAAVIEAATADIGRPYLYRGITLGRDIGTDTDRQFTYQGVNLKPLSPIALNGSRHPTTGDWSMTWVRRTRAGGEWRDFVDAALSESSEQYIVDIYADAGYTTVKRRITASTPACAYSSALQVADFGANQATLYLKLYQVSADVGLGYSLTTTITR